MNSKKSRLNVCEMEEGGLTDGGREWKQSKRKKLNEKTQKRTDMEEWMTCIPP
jgi:hypothetical protein